MKILLYSDILLKYVDDSTNISTRQEVHKIIRNENSTFLFSVEYIKFLREIVGENEVFDKFIDDLYNNYSSEHLHTVGAASFDETFTRIYKNHQSNVLMSFSLNLPNEAIIQATNNKIAVLSQQQKPNYHWLVVNLAILHPFTLSVDEIDFEKEEQIDKFFNDLLSIPKKIPSVTIFDDYYNVDGHKKYTKIANQKDVTVYYCTRNNHEKADRQGNFNKDKYDFLKKAFPRLELYTKSKGSHTRRIIFEDFIINPDIDLDLLNKKDKKMWSVHIRFSKERANEIIEIRNNDYRRFKPSR